MIFTSLCFPREISEGHRHKMLICKIESAAVWTAQFHGALAFPCAQRVEKISLLFTETTIKVLNATNCD